jgi:hypothetical protein
MFFNNNNNIWLKVEERKLKLPKDFFAAEHIKDFNFMGLSHKPLAFKFTH